MSEPRPAARPGRWRKRGRVLLAVGALVFLAGAGGIFLLREKPRAYTPGTEAATGEEITSRLARDVPAEASRIEFRDVAAEAGIAFRHFDGKRSTQLPEDMGSGLAWGDYDDDGDPDLFLVNEAGPLTLTAEQAQASPARSRLFRNEGDGRFSDVTDAAGLKAGGWGMGAAWGDFDSDGRLDLVVTRFGTSLLFHNRGDGTFEDVSRASGIDRAEGFWSGASWGDYDRDGDADLYICGYVRYRHDPALAGKSSSQYNAVVPYTLNPSTYPPERNLLLRNDRGVFHEVAAAAGVDNPTGRSLSATWADFDFDGWPDLYVANDVSDNAMFRNLGNGRFQDVSHSAWVADYRGAMGLAVGDWDGDADLDIFITHWLAQENALYDNQRGVIPASDKEPLHFVDEADMFGLGQIALDFVGWGTEFLDYDDDGRLDILAVNGSTFQREDDPSLLIPMKNQLFWNAGRPKGFFEVGPVSGAAFGIENVGRGAAAADYDGDGDLDVAINVNGGDARLLRNEGGSGRGSFLRVVLRGPSRSSLTGKASPFRTSPFAIGTVVRIATGPLTQIRITGGSSSYQSQSPPGEVFFGTGSAKRIDRLEVEWPDGEKESWTNLPVRATVLLVEGEAPQVRPAPEEGSATEAGR